MTLGLTEHIDATLVLVYAFWIFFAILIYYLHRESRREGYPLETDTTEVIEDPDTITYMPNGKTYLLPDDNASVIKPDNKREARLLKLRAGFAWPGAPKIPTGNPMKDAVGPASYAERKNVPDRTLAGKPKIVPLRSLFGVYAVSAQDPNPIGMKVYGCDHAFAGVVTDIWVDRTESLIRYYEVAVSDQPKARTALLPVNFTVIRGIPGQIYVHAITGAQFTEVPLTKNPNEITLLEEDKICAYYGGGLLYAIPIRQESVL